MSEGDKKRKFVFDGEFGKGEYADIIGLGVVKSGDKIDCIHINFGQLRHEKREEKEHEIIEHSIPLSKVILNESVARSLLKLLSDALGEGGGGD